MIEEIGSKYFELFKSTLQNSFSWSHLILLVSLTIALLFIELIYEGWDNSSLKRIKEFKTSTRVDLFAWILEVLNLYTVFSLAFSFAACYYLVGFMQRYTGIQFHIENPILQFGVIFVVSDLKGWISHFVFHKSNTLWQLHSFHHAATNFNILTRQRGHFLEAEIKRFFDVLPFVLFGAPIASYLFIRIITELHQMVLHSSSNSNWGFIGRYVLVSPAAHRLHHSIDPAHYNKNLGVTFIFWDRLFGTYHPMVNDITIGIPNNPFNKGYFRDSILCQWLFIKTGFQSTISIITKPFKSL